MANQPSSLAPACVPSALMILHIGQLVVIPQEPHLGVGRIVSLDEEHARLLLYDTGSFLKRKRHEVIPCPPGPWVRTPPCS